MEKIGILFSGGLESTSLVALYKELNYKPILIYIRSGFKWEEAEIFYAKQIAKYFNEDLLVLDLVFPNTPDLGEVSSVKENIILMRNLFLITNAANFLVNENVFNLSIGLFGDKNYPDTSLEYISNIEKLISLGINKKFNIHLPFYGLSKKEVFNKYHKKIPINLIFSCVNPIGNKRCHKCYKCKKLDEILNES